jgi:ElaA protein
MREGTARVHATWAPRAISLSAQAHLARFYGELGFAVCGAGYDEDGIPHVPMEAIGR